MKLLLITLAFISTASVAVGLKLPPWKWNDIDEEAAERVTFSLYTRENPDTPEVTTGATLPAEFQYFDASRPTKVLIHGWHGKLYHNLGIKDALLTKTDSNVIVVNWKALDSFIYPVVVKRITPIARQVGAVVQSLVDVQGMLLEDLHIVGHSLGAHISGLSTTHVNGTVARITGLDPAGPLFKSQAALERRLQKSHAAFVDIIHTCANVFGFPGDMGHADFYPNGGVAIQPGCTASDLTTGRCSHNRVYDLFEESVLLEDSFLALPAVEPPPELDDELANEGPCSAMDPDAEKVPMGLYTPTSTRGAYCLRTRASEPYGYGAWVPNAIMKSVSNDSLVRKLQAKLKKSLSYA